MSRPGPIAGLWVAGVACLVLAQQPWWTVAWSDALGSGAASLTGTAATSGLARALTLAALGGTLLAWWLGPTGRRIVAAPVGFVHGAGLVLAAINPSPGDAAVADALGAVRMSGAVELTATGWSWLHAAGATVGVVCAFWLAVRPGGRITSAVREERVPLADSLNTWKAMDDGIDPTAAPGDPRG